MNSNTNINTTEKKSIIMNYDSIIQSKSSEYVLFSFWPGMSDELFEKVADIEDNKGNIIDKSFSLIIDSKDYDTVSMKIVNNQLKQRIELHYEASFMGKYKIIDNILLGKNLGKTVVCESKQIQDLLKKISNIFNSKYKNIEVPVSEDGFVDAFEYNVEDMPLNAYKRWIGSNKVISLYYDTEYKKLDAAYDADIINNDITNVGIIKLNLQINYISRGLYEKRKSDYINNQNKNYKNKKLRDSLNNVKFNKQLKNI